jgi:hypothetical protein
MNAARQLKCFRTSSVPLHAGAKAVHAQRARIRSDMIRSRRQLMIAGQRNLSRILHNFFTQKIEAVCTWFEQRAHYASADVPMTKTAELDIHLGAHEALWRQAIEEVLGADADIELVMDYQPAVQSVAAKAYDRTVTFLGEEAVHDASSIILRRSITLAQQVTRINDTTKANLNRVIQQSMADGLTIRETVDAVRSSIPEIASARIPTIARTEIGRAVDQGTMQAIKESAVVKTVCVVGCQAVEPGIPTFDGRPTCNITGVDAQRVDELEFHPNHGGVIVPESFYE